MFGVQDGFDITIGNPPYVRADSGAKHLALRRAIEDSGQYETLWEKWDLYIPFIELSYKLLKPNGVTTMIVSDAFCHSKYAQKSQDWFLKNSTVRRLDFLSKIQIFDAGVRNITYLFQRADGRDNAPQRRVHFPEFGTVTLLPTDKQSNLDYRAFFPEDSNRQKLNVPTVALEEICYISYGLRANADDRYWQGEFTTDDCLSPTKDSTHPKPFVQGKDLVKWCARRIWYLEWGTERAPKKFSRPTFPQLHEAKEKLIAVRSPGAEPKVIYDDDHLHFDASSVGFVLWHSLKGVRNNSLRKVARYRGEKPPRPDLPNREELEPTFRT